MKIARQIGILDQGRVYGGNRDGRVLNAHINCGCFKDISDAGSIRRSRERRAWRDSLG